MNSRKLIASGIALLLLPYLVAAELPQNDGKRHLGVQSCAASSCHGSASVRDTYAVLQNEYITWARHDLHARAYSVLKNEQSRRIAANLGLEAAHAATVCLDCHSDYVPRAQRGLQFQLSDGVACEACHGGAENWLGVHISGGGNKHEQSLAAGMYPTDDPEARAELCLSCHLGTKDKFVTHEIMGAGHPRLSFDLQKFTDIQPRHYRVDEDYRQRKNHVEDTRVWAIGQVYAARQYLDLLQSPRMAGEGMFPELALFDCHACHHVFKDHRWQPNERTATPPGTVLLNDSSLAMSQLIAGVVAPRIANDLLSSIRELHLASQKNVSALRTAAAKLDSQLAQLAGTLRDKDFGRKQNKQMIEALTNAIADGRFSDYSDAEQATMALDVYAGVTGLFKDELDALYEAVADVEPAEARRFDPIVFAAVFRDSGTSRSDNRQPQRDVRQSAPTAGAAEPSPARPAPVILQPESMVSQPAPRTVVPARSSQPISATGDETHVVNANALRVRFTPDANAGVRGMLYFGDRVQVLNSSGDWTRISYNDADGASQRGWVATEFIDPL